MALKKKTSYFSCFNISNYFIRKFLTEINIKYTNLHGEILSSNKNAIPFYLERFNVLKLNSNYEYILNVDETSLYIKGVQNKSLFIDNKQKSPKKLDKTRITLLLGLTFTGVKNTTSNYRKKL
ncbi:hypothetical protein DMUE_2695 [Dictyocoela muelleri]|nr:hypothetical protein DMUE_2695 [Dictyocoela muelleri]